MKVILLEHLSNLGKIGDIVSVRPGYGRNYLLPHNKALTVNEDNERYFESIKGSLEKKEAERQQIAGELGQKIEGLELSVEAHCNSEGKLFGSVSSAMIIEALQKLGHEVGKQQVLLPSGSLNEIGVHDVSIRLHVDSSATIKVQITPIKT